MVAKLQGPRTALETRADAAIVAAIGYFLLAVLAIQTTSTGRDHATIWPADALILTLLLKEPKKSWPWILIAGWIANLAANAVTREWHYGLFVYGGINMLQTGMAAFVLMQVLRKGAALDDTSSAARFAVICGFGAPAVGAVLGGVTAVAIYGEPFAASFVRWYLSNALGLLVLTPFLYSLLDGSYGRWLREIKPSRRFEIAGLYLAHLALTLGVFLQEFGPLLFVPVCFVVLLSFRIGRLGTKLGVMIVALIGLVCTLSGVGPIARMGLGAGVEAMFLQVYLVVLLLVTMPIAGVVASRRIALARLTEREEALRHLLAGAPAVCLGFDAGGHCNWAQGPVKAYLGLTPEAMIGRAPESISFQIDAIIGELRGQGETALGVARTLEFTPVRRPHLTLEGTVGVLWQEGAPAGSVVTLRDSTERHARELAMLARAEADERTGLLNQSGFRNFLRTTLEEARGTTSLALLDVEGLEEITLRHGRVVGEKVLLEAARRISRAARETDTVGHLGTDAFGILLQCDLATARSICERISDSLRQSALYSDGSTSIIASVACGITPLRPGLDEVEALSMAARALESVKGNGSGGVSIAA